MTDKVALVQEAYDGFAKGDAGPLLSILGENIEWYEAEHSMYWPGSAFKGPQAVLDGVFSRIPQDFDNFTISIRRILGSGDTVVVEARYQAASTKPSGKPLNAQVAHIWDFEGGKVVRWQQYTDTWQFAQLTCIEHPL